MLPVVLYLCETWPVTLKDICGLRVYENRVLRRTLMPKRLPYKFISYEVSNYCKGRPI